MEGLFGGTQERLVKGSHGLAAFILRLATGLVLGTTVALVFREMLGHGASEGKITFAFTLIVVLGLFWRVSRKWAWTGVLVFDLILVTLALLLRMYVMVAPNL